MCSQQNQPSFKTAVGTKILTPVLSTNSLAQSPLLSAEGVLPIKLHFTCLKHSSQFELFSCEI